MAVLVDAWVVVARRSVTEDKLPGGIKGWSDTAPNRMTCVDRGLCCAGFMHEADALEFASSLERHGLRVQEGGAFRDVAIAHGRGSMRHACSWLAVRISFAMDSGSSLDPASSRPGLVMALVLGSWTGCQ